jgi:outer membrane receptor protein involved in Fe transport
MRLLRTSLLRLSGLGVLCAGSTAVIAQDPQQEPEGQQPVDEITVTGSRIQRDGFTTPTPVTVIGRETIDDLGLTNVGDIVKQLPMNNAEVSATNTSQGSINGYVTDANIGAELANLRGLNVAFGTRTLTLIDGHRFVPSTNGGAVDLSLIPSNLVARTEVVTGGASAAYGSDAVAGVVNVVLDHEFTGFRGQLDYSETSEGDGRDTHVGIGAGFELFDGRGHIVIGGEYTDTDAVGECTATRSWCRPYAIFQAEGPFAATNPEYNFVDNAVAIPQLTGGVLALTRAADPPPPGPAGGGFSQFAVLGDYVNLPPEFINKRFNEAGTALVDWQTGNFIDDAAVLMAGGDGPAPDLGVLMRVPVERQALYTRFQYDMTARLQGFVEASYGRRQASNSQVGGRNSFTGVGTFGLLIKADNFFLPADVRQALTAGGSTGMYVTKHNAALPADRLPESSADNETSRIVLGLEGALGARWEWDTYYTYGVNNQEQRLANLPRNTATAPNDTGLDADGVQFGFTSGPLADGSYPVVDANGIYGVSNLDLALDAVDNGAGQPACRINVAPTPAQQAILAAQPQIAALVAGCRPLNLLGLNNADPAALDWVLGTQTEDYEFTQHVVGGNVVGDVMDLWAGPWTVAAGAELRSEEGETLHTAPVQYWSPDYGGDFLGEQDIAEAYVESDLILLRDKPGVRNLGFNAAARRTRTEVGDNTPYTTALEERTFNFTSWKTSLVWDVTDTVRFRGTRSEDTRAPGFRELFFPGRPTPNWTLGVTNPWITPNPAGPWVNDPNGADLPRNGGGNPDLTPETAETNTFGIVYQPGGVADGLRLSLDWYQIKLHDGIANIYTNGIITNCYYSGGASNVCKNIVPIDPTENGATGYTDYAALITGSSNVSNFTVEGIDFESVYNFDIGAGNFGFRLLLTYMDQLLVTDENRGQLFGRDLLLAVDGTDYAGQVGAGGVDDVASFSESPKRQGNMTFTYARGGLRTTLQGTYVGKAKLYNDLIGVGEPGWGIGVPNTLNIANEVGSYFNWTVSGSWRFGNGMEIFAVVNNMFDEEPNIAPPLTTGAIVSGGGASITNPVFYDAIGRRFRFGMRFAF